MKTALCFPPFAPISIWDPDDGSSSYSVCDSRGQHPRHRCRQQQSGQNGESDVCWKNYLASTFRRCPAIVFVSRALQTHYVISEGQTELDGKQVSVPSTAAQVHPDPLEQPAVSQQTTTQYIITTTTNGTGASEVHITKPWHWITHEETLCCLLKGDRWITLTDFWFIFIFLKSKK